MKMKAKLIIISLLIALTTIIDCKSGDENYLIPAKFGEKWGYIDVNGKWIINPRYDYAFLFGRYDLAVIKVEDKEGFIDKTGKIVIEPQFELVTPFNEDGLAWFRKDGQDGYIDKKGQITDRKRENKNKDDGWRDVGFPDGKYGAINEKLNIYIEPQFDDSFTSDFEDDEWAVVSFNHEYGYIDKTGKFMINPQFVTATQFQNDIAKVGVPHYYNYPIQYGYIDRAGKYVIEPKFAEASNFTDYGLARARECDNCRWGIIDKTGNYIAGNQKFIDVRFFKDLEVLFVKNDEDKWGIIDRFGNYIAQPQFDDIVVYWSSIKNY